VLNDAQMERNGALPNQSSTRDGYCFGSVSYSLKLPLERQSSDIDGLVMAYDRLTAFVLGRPYALSDRSVFFANTIILCVPDTSVRHHDTLFPTSEGLRWAKESADGENGDFHRAKWKLCRIIVRATPYGVLGSISNGRLQGHVADEAFSIYDPTYDTILRLDAEIRSLNSSIPERIRFTPFTGPTLPPPEVATAAAQRSPAYVRLHMQRHSLAVMTNETWRM
jgi:hypothetical protein